MSLTREKTEAEQKASHLAKDMETLKVKLCLC